LQHKDEQRIKNEYANCLSKIKEITKLRMKEKDNEKMQTMYRNYNSTLELNQKIMVGLLYLSASDISNERCKLVKYQPNRKLDFYKVIVSNMEEVSLSFDDEQCNTEYIYEKIFCAPSKIVVQRLKLAMEIMDGK
jgi:hypothetical protein